MGHNRFVFDLESSTVAPAPTPKVCFELPPLILHPLHDPTPNAFISHLVLGEDRIDRYLEARYVELRALCLLGKDLNRWLEYCMEHAGRSRELTGLTEANLLALLVRNTPENVARKMQQWEVHDFRLIFSRAIGLNTVFPNPPAGAQVSEDLLRNFHHYADALYRARLGALSEPALPEGSLSFDVYASGEYAQMLEKSWERLGTE